MVKMAWRSAALAAGAAQRTKRRWRRAGALALAVAVCTAATGSALARGEFDGNWSVLIVTRRGGCDPAVRYGVEINNGVVSANGGPATVQGRVSRRGAVRVSVRAGMAWANGSGRLNLARGNGVWEGQGASGACYGTWLAQRRSDTAQNAPRRYYNYYNRY